MSHRLPVHVRVADAATKAAVPVRLRITDAAGRYYAPLGRQDRFPCGRGEAVGSSVRVAGSNFAHIDGGCEVALPAGVPLRFQAVRGPEWEPLDRTLTLGAGQMAVRLELTRWHDRAAGGWASFDARAFAPDPHAAWLEAVAEDLDAAHLLARSRPMLAADGETYPTAPHLLAFSGQGAAVSRGGCDVAVGTFNTHPVLGSLALLNTHRVVYPLAFGGADGPDDWSLCDWADQARRKGGVAVWCDPFGDPLGTGGEALVALILGKIDAAEYSAGPRPTPLLPRLYRLWSAGLPVTLVGASGKEDNKTPLGAMRTYARGGAWADAVRLGRTFVTNGPLLDWPADGPPTWAWAESVVPFERLEVIADGTGVARAPARQEGSRWAARLDGVTLPAGARWAAVRCVGPKDGPLTGDAAFAHSSPVRLGGSADPDAAEALIEAVGRTRAWLDAEGRYENPRRKHDHLDRCDAAVAELRRRAGV